VKKKQKQKDLLPPPSTMSKNSLKCVRTKGKPGQARIRIVKKLGCGCSGKKKKGVSVKLVHRTKIANRNKMLRKMGIVKSLRGRK